MKLGKTNATATPDAGGAVAGGQPSNRTPVGAGGEPRVYDGPAVRFKLVV